MLLTQEKKLEYKRIIKLIKDMKVPKEYCGRQKSIKLSVHIKGESPFYIPDNFGIQRSAKRSITAYFGRNNA